MWEWLTSLQTVTYLVSRLYSASVQTTRSESVTGSEKAMRRATQSGFESPYPAVTASLPARDSVSMTGSMLRMGSSFQPDWRSRIGSQFPSHFRLRSPMESPWKRGFESEK